MLSQDITRWVFIASGYNTHQMTRKPFRLTIFYLFLLRTAQCWLTNTTFPINSHNLGMSEAFLTHVFARGICPPAVRGPQPTSTWGGIINTKSSSNHVRMWKIWKKQTKINSMVLQHETWNKKTGSLVWPQLGTSVCIRRLKFSTSLRGDDLC